MLLAIPKGCRRREASWCSRSGAATFLFICVDSGFLRINTDEGTFSAGSSGTTMIRHGCGQDTGLRVPLPGRPAHASARHRHAGDRPPPPTFSTFTIFTVGRKQSPWYFAGPFDGRSVFTQSCRHPRGCTAREAFPLGDQGRGRVPPFREGPEYAYYWAHLSVVAVDAAAGFPARTPQAASTGLLFQRHEEKR